MATKNIKGYMFEYFVRKVLISCGFSPVLPDGELIYNNSIGTMIHGLGQPHNADVLVTPPFQVPFYHKSRLIIECKHYDKPLGLMHGRNVLGLREDINNFDIVTPDILKNRRNYRRKGKALYPIERYTYQVALASFSGFKSTLQEFAITHKIPLISFSESSFYLELRDRFSNELQSSYVNMNEYMQKNLINVLKGYDYPDTNQFDINLRGFFNHVSSLAMNMVIGILENGTILFLYKVLRNNNENIYPYDNGTYHIYFSDDAKSWRLETINYDYFFELPETMMNLWNQYVKDEDITITKQKRRISALNYKEHYFPKIYLYSSSPSGPQIEIKKLSNSFIENARDRYTD